MKQFLILFLLLTTVACNVKKDEKKTTGDNEIPENPAPSSFVYTNSDLILNKGKHLEALFPSYFGSPTSFSITPALPAGLSLNTSNGIISGTPIAEMEKTSYVVTASNSYGSDTANLDITVKWSLPVNIKTGLKVGGGVQSGSLVGQHNNNLFFGNNVNGGQLWTSNGTSSGTVLVHQFDGANGFSPQNFISFGGSLYFLADALASGIELYKTNGTSASTSLIKDLRSGSASSNIRNLIVSGSYLYFLADIGAGEQLFRTDGTSAGTIQLTNFSLPPFNLVNHNNQLYFVANDGINGEEIFKTDGVSVELAANIDGQNTNSAPRHLTSVGNYLYFRADGGTGEGSELYRMDNLTHTPELVFDIMPGATGSSIEYIFNFMGAVLFSPFESTNGRELWISSDLGTNIISNVADGSTSSNPVGLVEYNSEVFFKAYRADVGYELFKTDGAEISLVGDIRSGIADSALSNLQVVNNFLYFLANNGNNGIELHRLNQDQEVEMISDLTAGGNSSDLVHFININQKLIFFKRDAINDVYDLYFLTP